MMNIEKLMGRTLGGRVIRCPAKPAR
jgi:hypothetical protein